MLDTGSVCVAAADATLVQPGGLGMAKTATRRFSEALRSVFPRREIYIRTAGEVHYLALTPTVQMIGCISLTAFLIWGVFASVSTLFPDAALAAKTRQVLELRAGLTELTRAHDALQARLMDSVEREAASRARAETSTAARDQLDRAKREADARLAAIEIERDKLGAQRVALESRVSLLESAVGNAGSAGSALARSLAERDAALMQVQDLKSRLAQLDRPDQSGAVASIGRNPAMAAAERERDEARAETAGLRARLAGLEGEAQSGAEASAKMTLMMQERNEARQQSSDADRRARDLEGAVRASHERLADLEASAQRLQASLDETKSARDVAERERSRLASHVGTLEAKLAGIESEQGAFLAKLEETTGTTVRQIEKLIKATGLKLEDLIDMPKPAGKSGQGGPLKAMSRADLVAFAKANALDERDIEGRVARLSGDLSHLNDLRSVLISIPLRPPVEDYELSSGFGPREDPFTGRPAMHEGLDLRAERHTPILTTAPGKISFAGRDGAYGKMVEVDHGHGISTRYGHLDRIDVTEGQSVDLGEVVGLLGNTGRSTGNHVHYEVLVDGKPRNPIKFLEATENVLKK